MLRYFDDDDDNSSSNYIPPILVVCGTLARLEHSPLVLGMFSNHCLVCWFCMYDSITFIVCKKGTKSSSYIKYWKHATSEIDIITSIIYSTVFHILLEQTPNFCACISCILWSVWIIAHSSEVKLEMFTVLYFETYNVETSCIQHINVICFGPHNLIKNTKQTYWQRWLHYITSTKNFYWFSVIVNKQNKMVKNYLHQTFCEAFPSPLHP
jgi:hypothetical protein